jgi:hypothetical protein
MTTITKASREWATRPPDQRFTSLEDLYTAVSARRQRALEAPAAIRLMQPTYNAEGDLYLADKDGAPWAAFTHYSLGQFATMVGAPSGFLRELPAPLAAANLAYKAEQSDRAGKALILRGVDGQPTEFRAITSQRYGRIWDQDVVHEVVRLNGDGRWVIPAASYQARDPKRATTLYSSDHDVFVFLVDPSTPIEVEGETLFRGFMAWNSETGARTFGLMTFLYRFCCDNRIVWGARNVSQLTLRHTRYGPDRFAYQAAPALAEYAKSGTTEIVDTIRAAKRLTVGSKVEEVEAWLVERGFTQALAKASVRRAEEEEGDPTRLWNLVQGLTAQARGMAHTDDRVDLERKASGLLGLVGR